MKGLFRRKSYESVYFYTFHKCASSLFSRYILKNIQGLQHIDYAKMTYNNEKNTKVDFNKNGHVYGPIRLSADPISPVYRLLVAPTSKIDFIRDNTSVFLVRDPRDIIVSAYYSFGYTHGISKSKAISKIQEQRRNAIQSKTIDEYALTTAPTILSNFEVLGKLADACSRNVVLKYEDMISNWDHFASGLTKYIDINQSVLAQIYEKSRLQEKENKESHRRSGQAEQFRRELKEDTIITINELFSDVLTRLDYTP